MRIELGYPEPEVERELLRGGDRRGALEAIEPVLTLDELEALQLEVDAVQATDLLLDYVQRLANHSRRASEFAFGLSPRGALALLQAAKAWALMQDRRHVVPEDVQTVLPAVVAHRLREAADFGGPALAGGGALAQHLLASVDVVR